MVFPGVVFRMILISGVDVSIYLLAAIAVTFLSISVNILGRRKLMNGTGAAMYLSILLYMVLLMLFFTVYMLRGTNQVIYYTSYVLMILVLNLIAIILMKEYSGKIMSRNVVPYVSYSIVLNLLLVLTIFLYPGRDYLFKSHFFGYQALPYATKILHLFAIIPITVLISFSLLYSIFRDGMRRSSIYISLAGLVLLFNIGLMQFGTLMIMDFTFLIASLLLISGFNKMAGELV